MKINYRLANGKTAEVEVTEAQAAAIKKETQRFENNETKHKLRRARETSLDYLTDEFDWEQADEAVNVEEQVIREDEADRVRWAIARLTEKQQLLVWLCFFEGKEFQEVAEILGVSKAAVSQQFKTIYAALKKYLENLRKEP